MGIEDAPARLPSPELPEAESFTPIESISELSPEPGSTFDIMSKKGSSVLESGTILGIFEDQKYDGGGYLQVELRKGQNNEKRSGKVTLDKFLEFYNNRRVSSFKNPSDPEERVVDDSIDFEFTSKEEQSQGGELVEQIRSLEPNLDPQFVSYLSEVIERNGIAQIKQVMSHMSDASRTYLREQMANGNLPGFVGRMEMLLERATDPDWKVKQQRRLDDSLSGNPQRVMRATREMLEKFSNQVDLTNRHLKPRTTEEVSSQEELALLLRKMTGKK